jgi:dGTPase
MSYQDSARQRWVVEAPKRSGRTDFERDRARVLHSAALRRLAGKTQVVRPDESDFLRTRLTHSLECAQIGRELGKSLGCDPDVVEVACLAHDLGHPPFGHTGEAALDALAGACGGFEGNAQSLRLLTRLEAKTFGPEGRSAGLNLTRASLDAATKYPWPKDPADPARAVKYGMYPDDATVFAWLREGVPAGRRCLEAQVMDWADDVTYSVHDFEDAVYCGHLELAQLRDPDGRAAVCRAGTRYAAAGPDELEEALDTLLGLEFWPTSYDSSLRAQAGLKNATSQLIGRLCDAAQEATRAAYGPSPLRRYDADLRVPRQARLECAVLKAITAHFVMARAGAETLREQQQELVTGLAGALLAGAPESLEVALRPDFAAAADDAARLRVVVDQVASLTDLSDPYVRCVTAGAGPVDSPGGRTDP